MKTSVTPKIVRKLLGLCVIISAFALLLEPEDTAAAARDAIDLCIGVIIPSLFPFFVVSSLLIDLGLPRAAERYLGAVTRPLFRISGAGGAALLMGFIGGYPVGARAAAELFKSGQLSKDETERLLAFCNNSGPAFMLGAVGAGIFSNTFLGWLLYLAHFAASLTVGIIFRFYGKKPEKNRNPQLSTGNCQLSTGFISAVKSSFQSVLNVCAFVIFFAVAIRVLYSFGVFSLLALALRPFGLGADTAERFISGLFEVTSGLWSLSGADGEGLTSKLALAAFMLGWAGLSVHCQVLSIAGECGLRTRPYIFGKFLHGCVSSAYMLALIKLFGTRVTVSSILLDRVDGISRMDFVTSTVSAFCVMIIAGLAGIILFCAENFLKNHIKNS